MCDTIMRISLISYLDIIVCFLFIAAVAAAADYSENTMTLQRSLSTDYNQNDLNLQNLTPYEQLNHLLGKILVTADIRFLGMLIMCRS